jgi:hypothetical protein
MSFGVVALLRRRRALLRESGPFGRYFAQRIDVLGDDRDLTDDHGGTDDAIVEVQVRPLVQLVPGRVQGAGSLDGLERVFAFSVDNRRGPTAVSGQLTFLDFERRFVFQSIAIVQLEIQSDGRRAIFEGEGKLNGRSGYQFVVTIEDGVYLLYRERKVTGRVAPVEPG